MERKHYIKPTITIIHIEQETILAGSGTGSNGQPPYIEFDETDEAINNAMAT